MHSQIRARFIATQEIAAPAVTATCYWVIIVSSLRDEERKKDSAIRTCHRRLYAAALGICAPAAPISGQVWTPVSSLCVFVVVNDHVTR